jgi:SAM-dependent methyltransferase
MNVSEPAYWSERYRSGQTGWDLGAETPVFQALLHQGGFPVHPRPEQELPTVIVPGCGYGHDALLLARAGYRVIAVDFAPEPLHVLRQRAAAEKLPVEALCEDLFRLPERLTESADMVLEYTCYCAIDPQRRPEYFRVLCRLLRPGGWLVGLFFPLSTEPPVSGPPFPVQEAEVVALATQAGLRLQSRQLPLTSHPARLGREVLLMFQKAECD